CGLYRDGFDFPLYAYLQYWNIRTNMKEVLENKEKNRTAAKQLAERYRYEFVDLKGAHLDLELFHSIQADLMFRYNFVPLRLEGNALVVAMADPSDLVVV